MDLQESGHFPRNFAKGSYSKHKRQQALKGKNSQGIKIKTEYLLLAQMNHHKEITKILGFESRRDPMWANTANTAGQRLHKASPTRYVQVDLKDFH